MEPQRCMEIVSLPGGFVHPVQTEHVGLPGNVAGGECLELVLCPVHVLVVGDAPPDREVGEGVQGEVLDKVEQRHPERPEVELTPAAGVLDRSPLTLGPLIVNGAPLPSGSEGRGSFSADKDRDELVASGGAGGAGRDLGFEVSE
jgi:hypothetical protein